MEQIQLTTRLLIGIIEKECTTTQKSTLNVVIYVREENRKEEKVT